MMLTNFIVASAVFIAATLNFGAQGFPRPQANIWDGSTNFVNSADAMVFDGPTSGSRTSLTHPQAGLSNVLDGIVFDGPTSGSRTSLTQPQDGLSNVLDGIVFDGPISRSSASLNPPTQSPVLDPTPVPTTVRPEVALCARNCIVTSQYNPVCGSDGAKYNNAELLICVRNCGKNVKQLRTGPCPLKAPRV